MSNKRKPTNSPASTPSEAKQAQSSVGTPPLTAMAKQSAPRGAQSSVGTPPSAAMAKQSAPRSAQSSAAGGIGAQPASAPSAMAKQPAIKQPAMRSTQPGTAGKASDGLGAGAGSGTQLRSAAKTSSSSDEQMVRERAYALWEQAGRPDGRENEFWHRARQQLMTEGDHSRSSTSH